MLVRRVSHVKHWYYYCSDLLPYIGVETCSGIFGNFLKCNPILARFSELGALGNVSTYGFGPSNESLFSISKFLVLIYMIAPTSPSCIRLDINRLGFHPF